MDISSLGSDDTIIMSNTKEGGYNNAIIGPSAEGPGAARTVRATADRRRRGARGGGGGGYTGMEIHEVTIQSPNILDRDPTY